MADFFLKKGKETLEASLSTPTLCCQSQVLLRKRKASIKKLEGHPAACSLQATSQAVQMQINKAFHLLLLLCSTYYVIVSHGIDYFLVFLIFS